MGSFKKKKLLSDILNFLFKLGVRRPAINCFLSLQEQLKNIPTFYCVCSTKLGTIVGLRRLLRDFLGPTSERVLSEHQKNLCNRLIY